MSHPCASSSSLYLSLKFTHTHACLCVLFPPVPAAWVIIPTCSVLRKVVALLPSWVSRRQLAAPRRPPVPENKRPHFSWLWYAMCYITQLLNAKKLNNMAVAWTQHCFGEITAQVQRKLWYSPMANTPEKLREWKQSLRAFNSCRQAQSIIALWSCIWWEEHHWELNAIILCKCHGRRLHVAKLLHLKYNIYESHRFFIIIQVDTIDNI